MTLIACGDSASGAKTEQSSAERVAAALDVCAEGSTGFAQNVCENRTLAALDNQVRETLVAEKDGDGLRFDVILQGERETVFITYPGHS